MKKSMWLLFMVMISAGVHADDGRMINNAPKLLEKDFVTTDTNRLPLLTDTNLMRDVKNLIDDAHGALKYDGNGNACIDSSQPNITNLKMTATALQFQLATGKRPRPLTIKKYSTDLEISESEDNKDTGSLNIGLTNGQLFSVIKRMDAETWLIVGYDPKEKKFHKEIKKYAYVAVPEQHKNIIWPDFPADVAIDSKVAPEVVERLKGEYKVAVSLVNEARRRQSEAKYSQSGKVCYGKLTGQDDIQGFSFMIWSNRFKSMTVNYKNGKSVDIQFRPFVIHVSQDDKSFLEMRIGDDGTLKSYTQR